MLLDAPAVDGARRMQRVKALPSDEDLDDPAVVRRSLAAHESGLFHAMDDARQPALAGEDPAGQLVHPEALLGLLEVDEHVVPPQGHATFHPKLGVEDVDERKGAFEEHPPHGELVRGRA
jgi:hypothetical protein